MKFLTCTSPCCNSRFSVFRLLSNETFNGCKHKLEHKSLYCPACDERISKEFQTQWPLWLKYGSKAAVLVSFLLLSSYWGALLGVIATIVLAIAIYITVMRFIVLPPRQLACYKEIDRQLPIVEREHGDPLLEHYGNVRVDASEKMQIRKYFFYEGVEAVVMTLALIGLLLYATVSQEYIALFALLVVGIYVLKDRLILKDEKEE